MKLGLPWRSKGKKSPERTAGDNNDDAASMHERLDDVTRQLERLSRVTAGKLRPPRTAADTMAQEPPPGGPEVDPSSRLDRRLEQFAAASPAPTVDVARYAGDRTLNRNPLRPIYSRSDLEQTVAEIAARQRALDGEERLFEARAADVQHPKITPPSQNMSGLEEQLRRITTQIESVRRPCAAEEAIPALRQELSDISRSLADTAPRNAIETIEAEVRGLGARLDQPRRSGTEVAALTNLEQGLAEVRDALRSLRPAESLDAIQELARKIDRIVANQQDPVVLQQLESAITGLRSIVVHVASDDTLARLTEEVHGIAVRLEHAEGPKTPPGLLTNLERQIGLIAEAIDLSNAQSGQVRTKLETMVGGLTEKIEKLQMSRGDTVAFGQLEDRIANLVEKLDVSGSRFNQLEAIERGLADILRASSGDPMESLKRDLDSVNGTLSRVVERLATIETEIRSGIRPPVAKVAAEAAAPVGATSPAKPDSPASATAWPPDAMPPPAATAKAPIPATFAAPLAKPATPPSERLAAPQAQRPPARERMPIDPNLPPDHPLEPGAAHARLPQSPAERIAASEAALRPAKPPVIPDPGGKSNFIAAARRAAQTAARSAPASDDRDATTPHGPGQTSSLRRRLTGRVKSMLVGTSVIILTLGAVRFGISLIEPHAADMSDGKQATTAPAIPAASKSATRISPDPIVTGSVKPDEVTIVDTVDPAAAGGDVPSSGTGLSADAAPPLDAHTEHTPTNIIPALPPKTEDPGRSAEVPLPPGRPAGERPVEPQSPLAAAAAGGDPAAAYELALRYIDGRGVPQSYKDAARWLARASEQGLAPAQFRLGSLYEKGQGVKKNLNRARKLYLAATDKGNAKAMHNLAVLYAEGIDGRPDYTTAVQWFHKAADRGIADSQYNLGVLYARGVGVEQNLAESYKWFALAARQGDRESRRKRDDVAAKLDPESLMAARLAVKTWTMESQPDEATTVKSPPGGWDREVPPTSAKRRPRSGAPLKLGPG